MSGSIELDGEDYSYMCAELADLRQRLAAAEARAHAAERIAGERATFMGGYTASIQYHAEDNCFLSQVLECPGCTSHGDSANESLCHLQEAFTLWMETVREQGLPIPIPFTLDQYCDLQRIVLASPTEGRTDGDGK